MRGPSLPVDCFLSFLELLESRRVPHGSASRRRESDRHLWLPRLLLLRERLQTCVELRLCEAPARVCRIALACCKSRMPIRCGARGHDRASSVRQAARPSCGASSSMARESITQPSPTTVVTYVQMCQQAPINHDRSQPVDTSTSHTFSWLDLPPLAVRCIIGTGPAIW